MNLKNPILNGFNASSSICKIGDDFFIANPTFEWFPGVMIHHSRDLKNWNLISPPLNKKHINMVGNPDSGGIWAPSLTYFDGELWLVYSDIKVLSNSFKDGHNYMTRLDLKNKNPVDAIIESDWSEPTYLNSSGFSPSMFHDDDGKQYILNMVWDHRSKNNKFYGISIQQYSNFRDRLVARPEIILKSDEYELEEYFKIFKKENYYYILTSKKASNTTIIFRSKNLYGSYEIYNKGFENNSQPSILALNKNEWIIAYNYKPINQNLEIKKIDWIYDWPVISKNQELKLKEHKFEKKLIKDDFDNKILNINFQSLRIPLEPDILTLNERDGHLRLYGRESLASKFVQSHIARQINSINFEAETKIEFKPYNFQQMAGLSMYYDTENWVSIYITYNEELQKKVLEISTMENQDYNQIFDIPIELPPDIPIYLKIKMENEIYNFYYSLNEIDFIKINIDFQSYKILNFNNINIQKPTFVGIFCIDGTFSKKYNMQFAAGHQDEIGVKKWLLTHSDAMPPKVFADFDYFKYEDH